MNEARQLSETTGDNSSASHNERHYWLDNLRTFMIFLVVVFHTAIVYEKTAFGATWWIVADPGTSDLPGILFLILDLIVMPAIFFVAGFVTPVSLQGKSAWEFVKGRIMRLMIPWVIAVFTLIPLYQVIFLHARNWPQESLVDYLYFNTQWSQNWLWFLPVLFAFNIAFLGLSRLPVKLSWLTLRKVIFITLALGVIYCFVMDYFGLHGWTKTFLIDFQNERLLVYFMVFLLGVFFHKQKVFDKPWFLNKQGKKRNIIIHCLGWLPLNLYLFMVIYSILKPYEFLISEMMDTFLLRLNFVLSVAYLLYASLTIFHRFLNKQGRLTALMNSNSYYVYLIHVVVLGGIAVLMIDMDVSGLLKFFITAVFTFVISNLLILLAKKTLKGRRYIRHLS